MLIRGYGSLRTASQSHKVLWLSPTKFVFEWEQDLTLRFPWGLESYGKKKMLVFAEEGKNLYFSEEGDYGVYSENDYLCYLCANGINLGQSGYAPNCLLGKNCVGVKFCRDFVRGPSFGENKTMDVGERREAAEKVFPNIIWRRCSYCENWNSKGVITFAPDGKVYENLDVAFCEILGRKPECDYFKTCGDFEVSHEPHKREAFFGPQRQLRKYLEELKIQEKTAFEKKKLSKK